MSIDAALGRLGNKSGVCTSSTRPTNPYSGQLIYETDTNRTLVYDNAAWLVVADNQVLSIDTTNSRVGIGDTTPSYKLDVNGDINATGDLRIGGTAIGEWTSYTPTTTNFTATFNNTDYLRINDWVHFRVTAVLTSNPTAAMFISVPVAASEPSYSWTRYSSTVSAFDVSTGTWYPGNYVSFINANTMTFANAAISSQWNATVPFTWTAADGDYLQFSMIYRAA